MGKQTDQMMYPPLKETQLLPCFCTLLLPAISPLPIADIAYIAEITELPIEEIERL